MIFFLILERFHIELVNCKRIVSSNVNWITIYSNIPHMGWSSFVTTKVVLKESTIYTLFLCSFSPFFTVHRLPTYFKNVLKYVATFYSKLETSSSHASPFDCTILENTTSFDVGSGPPILARSRLLSIRTCQCGLNLLIIWHC